MVLFFFFKQKTAYEMRISDWSSDVCSSDLGRMVAARMGCPLLVGLGEGENFVASDVSAIVSSTRRVIFLEEGDTADLTRDAVRVFDAGGAQELGRASWRERVCQYV